MQKIFIFILSVFLPMLSFAQLSVDSLGCVLMADQVTTIAKNVTVGGQNSLSINNVGLQSVLNHFGSSGNVALLGESTEQSSGASIGVIGVAGKGFAGYNFGTIGGLKNANYGAGILGLDSYSLPIITDKYAGYFSGKVYIAGSVFINGVQASVSDMRLKENVVSLSSAFPNSGVLDKVMQIKSYKYNFKKETDTDSGIPSYGDESEAGSKVHYGVIAQELEEVFPELVTTNSEGLKAVNYTELIPLLLESIKELRQDVLELHELLKNQ